MNGRAIARLILRPLDEGDPAPEAVEEITARRESVEAAQVEVAEAERRARPWERRA